MQTTCCSQCACRSNTEEVWRSENGGGLIVLLSAYRKTSVRAYVLLFLFFVFTLGIINIISKTPTQTLMEFFAANTGNDYASVLSASYQLASGQGSLGG